jgi:type IV secretory pathway VirB2 component (pilin)
MIGRLLGLAAARALSRIATNLLRWFALAALATALAPVSLVAAGAFVAASRGWPPRRLLIASAWCVPMIAVWLGWMVAGTGWQGLLTAPYHAWLQWWRLMLAGEVARAAATVAPEAIPLGLAAGALAWTYRARSVLAGVGGLSPASAVTFDQRQWRWQVRAAKARIDAPGSVPLTTRSYMLVAGAVIRTVGHRAGTIATIGYERMRSHQVVVGTTGTGKTTLLLRLWAAFMATALQRHAAGRGDLPLLVVLDCKGGADARKIAARFRRVLRESGASTAVWPDDVSLSLWELPPRQLTTTLVDLIEHGTGAAAYYADVMEALIGMAVEAPCGPPRSAAELMDRLEPGWLAAAYSASATPADHALIRSSSRHAADVALRFRTLFRRLGAGLDGPGSYADADAWYCILEGTDQVPVAEAQARALTDLLASFAVRGPGRRAIVLAVDEFSAVSRRLPIWQLYERARSLGLAVQVSAQSWQGLAATEDERYRIAASAEGGIWLLRTPYPEPLTALAGTRKAIDTTRALGRYPRWRKQGSSRLHDVPVADPALIRRLEAGQVAYIDRGGVTYVQVKRLVSAPAAVPGRRSSPDPEAAHQPGSAAVADPARPDQAVAPRAEVPAAPGRDRPDVSPVLDAAFGPEPAHAVRAGGQERAFGSTASSGQESQS